MSSLTVKRKCPHEGACDIDAERADKASGSQQFDGGPYDHGAGSDSALDRRDGAAALAHGYIHAYVDPFLIHEHLLRITGPSLHDAGLVVVNALFCEQGPGNCSGSIRGGRRRRRRPSLSDGLTRPRKSRSAALKSTFERFRVPPEHADTAYRVPDPGMCLDTVLCLKYRRRVGRDNTVKYRWRTLQLLPDKSRPSYAGSVVEVLEGLDGRLAVQHEGRTVQVIAGNLPQRHRGSANNGAARVRRTATPRSRKPTPLQTARWKAVQKAKRKGLSIRGIARELSIHRDTVRKYIDAERPTHVARPRNVGSALIC